MELAIVAGIIIVVFLLLRGLLLKRSGQKRSNTKQLYNECQKKLRLPPDKADTYINEHINRLKEKYPGQSEEWYLEKILVDLERDRR